MSPDMIGIAFVGKYGLPTEWHSTWLSPKPEVFFSDLLKPAKFKSVRFIVQSLHNLFNVKKLFSRQFQGSLSVSRFDDNSE